MTSSHVKKTLDQKEKKMNSDYYEYLTTSAKKRP